MIGKLQTSKENLRWILMVSWLKTTDKIVAHTYFPFGVWMQNFHITEQSMWLLLGYKQEKQNSAKILNKKIAKLRT